MIRDTSAQDKVRIKSSSKLKPSMWIILSLIAAIVLAVAAIPNFVSLYSTEVQVDARQLRFDQVERGDLSRDVSVQGRVVAAISPTFYALADGTVALKVKAGDKIEAGQLLARIDSPALNNQLAQEESVLATLQLEIGRQKIDTKARVLLLNQQLELAKVDHEAAEREMQRALLSQKDNLISKVEYEQVEVALKKAVLSAAHALQNQELEKERLEYELRTRQTQLERQQLVVADLKRQLAELEIKAPFRGIIGNVAVQELQAVTRNTALLTAVDMTAFEVEVQIPETYADELGIGLSVQVSIDGENSDATLAAISPEVINGQVIGRIRFKDTPLGLRQNQRISARVFIESKSNVLKVRRGAFMESGGGRIAWVVANNQASRRQIQIGALSTSEVEILSGLKEGDQIITSSTSDFNQHGSVYLAR